MVESQDKHFGTIAAISDIHSNFFALDAVLGDIKKRGVDQIVNLGDILYGPIAPKATYELLMAYRNQIITICGNQDRQIYEATETEIANNPTMDFIVRDLPKDAIDWMQSLPFDCRLSKDVYLCHGTPTDDMIYLLEDIATGAPTVRSDASILSLLNGIDSTVIVCGHTHIPRTVTLSSGQMVINTGSVGYPAYEDDLPVVHKMQTYSPHASYALITCIETPRGKRWHTEHIKVAYDYEAASELALKNGRKDWAFVLKTGRVLSV